MYTHHIWTFKADHYLIRWLGLIGFGPLKPAKKSDWVWLGLIGFGPLKPAKKSDWVWLGLIGFGPLQPCKEK